MANRPRKSLQEDPHAVAREARARLPGLVRQVEQLLTTVDPIELLSQLTLFYQTHNSTDIPNREETARQQVQLEWLVWLVFARVPASPPHPRLIDARILEPLHSLLDEYYFAMAHALREPVEGLSAVENDIRMLAQLDALCVRGEMFHAQLERMALALYSPHNDWCLQNLHLTVSDAWHIATTILTRLGQEIARVGDEAAKLADKVRASPKLAMELDLPANARDVLANGCADGVANADSEGVAHFVEFCMFFSRSPEIVGFTLQELQDRLSPAVDPRRVAAFVDFLSSGPDSFREEPDPLALSPLAVKPMVRHDRRYYVFVPSLLLQSIVHAFHTALYDDDKYRPQYDDTRAHWLERSAVETFREMLPRAESGWGLKYGPKKQRMEVDGLIRYANKIILIECKWKSQTLLARSGDVMAALRDVDKAILAPLKQAKRAREYILSHGPVTFYETNTERAIVVDKNEVSEVFLVTLVGSEAWSQVAANLARLTPLGLFADGEYPWALSLNDLRVVADCLELPSQLFDYLRRRDEVQRDERFHVHDEWDLLGAYLKGALDAKDPRFKGKAYIAFQRVDDDIQDHYYRSDSSLDAGNKPRRDLPGNLRDLLMTVENASALERADAICVVLSWPNWGLVELGEALDAVKAKAVSDGRAHGVAVEHPWRSSGVTFACGTSNRGDILQVMRQAGGKKRRQSGAAEWVGFGIDLTVPEDLIVIYDRRGRVNSSPWMASR